MKLTFLGTRGYIEAKSRRHRRHSSLMVAYQGAKIMVDCGQDWAGRVKTLKPHAIFITHAHPDHAFGLKSGTDRPVYATAEAWETMADYPIEDQRTVEPRNPVSLRDITFEAFPVIHSLRAPAVGYRITAGRVTIFYVPDVIDIHDRKAALSGIRLYVGDGATLARPLVRRLGSKLFGHTTVRAQLGWCQENRVKRAIFTHCGTDIVAGDERKLRGKFIDMARERGVKAKIAYDGMEVTLR